MEARDDAYRLNYKAQTLKEGERMQSSWIASVAIGGKAITGGNLVLTNQRLLFEPMRTPKDILLGPIARLFGLKSAGDILNKTLDDTKLLEPWSISLPEIAAIDALLGRPPQLRVILINGESKIFIISASRWSPIWSTVNEQARDEVVTRLRTALNYHYWDSN